MPELDSRMALDQAAQNELVQRKIQMDALRARLGDGRDEKTKLRESCEGFESIFLQKMWEQMRKNVSKEGYLHSKDEEAYQSMFDVELCKKMASAGGIGLADMLYEQLSQKLDHAGRATTPAAYRAPMPTPTAATAKAEAAQAEKASAPVEKLTAESLYAEADPESLAAEATPEAQAVEPPGLIEIALNELRSIVEVEDNKASEESAATQPAAGQAAAAPVARATAPEIPAPAVPVTPAPVQAPAAPEPPAASKAVLSTRSSRKSENPRSASWIGHGPVSAEPKPLPRFRRADKTEPAAPVAQAGRAAAPASAALPADGPVVGAFGWGQEPGGQRRWNNGLDIAAAPGAPVRACLDGSVVFVGEQRGMGSLVVLEHEGGLRSYYAGVEAGDLAEGRKIQRGSNFAKVAAQPDPEAGAANSALLHFEIKRGEMALNPESVLGKTSG